MKVWLMNHYATGMSTDKAGRHYWFARELKKRGYEATIFCANTFLNNDDVILTNGKKYIEKEIDGIPFVFVKTMPAQGNGLARIRNWYMFYRNLMPTSNKYSQKMGKPDIIIASSVHPLTLIAGIKIARKFGVPCICEIRDLWPEAIFQFGKAKEKSLIGRVLIRGEHWIYKKADALIFTKEGDTDYLKEKKWTTVQGGDIDLNKCFYINNGIDLDSYVKQIHEFTLEDPDLLDESKFNVIYAGAIRPVNNVSNILDAAEIIKKQEKGKNVQFVIYGDGIQLPMLRERVKNENLNNVKLKGYINRQYMPFILSRSSINILNYSQTQYNWSRGNSSNKLFEYMASGKPIISTVRMGYSIINKYKCGEELCEDTPQALAEEIIKFHDMSVETRLKLGNNAYVGAKEFDMKVLTDRLVSGIDYAIMRKQTKK